MPSYRRWACALVFAYGAPALAQEVASGPAVLRWAEVAAAIDRDPRVTASRARVRSAEGGMSAARTPPNPQLEAAAPGVLPAAGGGFENQERAMERLAILVPIALAFLLLYLALGSVPYTALVLLNLPVALVGGVVAVVLFRMPLSVSVAVAFIVLLGVAVQNGVVLVTFLRQLRQRGLSVSETVEQGCYLRFRPLLTTALTAFIGLLPMLYATGSGADVQKPLAVVLVGGLVTSTVLTLVVLPTVYSLVVNRFGSVATGSSRRQRPEPGYPGRPVPPGTRGRTDPYGPGPMGKPNAAESLVGALVADGALVAHRDQPRGDRDP